MGYLRVGDNRSRRYARCCHRVESGLIGRDITKFYRTVLTTRLGDANDWATMQKHLKLLKMQLVYRGVVIEYVFLPHVSDKNGLLHLDGVIWVKKGNVSIFELQVLWSNIHGATEVAFELVRVLTEKQLIHYVVSHMFKDYDKVVGFKGRMLISKGWMPQGWLALDKILTQKALNEVYQLGPIVWDIKRELFRGYLNGETIMFRHDGIWYKFKRNGGD